MIRREVPRAALACVVGIFATAGCARTFGLDFEDLSGAPVTDAITDATTAPDATIDVEAADGGDAAIDIGSDGDEGTDGADAFSPWVSIGAADGTALAVAVHSLKGLQLFDLAGTSLRVRNVSVSGAVSSPESSIEVGLAMDLSVASRDDGATLNAFYRDGSDQIAHCSWSGAAFDAPVSDFPGTYFAAGPSVAGVDSPTHGMPDRFDLLAVSDSEGTSWFAARYPMPDDPWRFDTVGNPKDKPLAARSPAALRANRTAGETLHFFAISTDGAVWTRHFRKNDSPPGWTDWTLLGGSIDSGLVATSRGDHVEVFGVGTSGQVVHRFSDDDGNTWTGDWLSLGRPSAGVAHSSGGGYIGPAAVALASGIRVFVRGGDSKHSVFTIDFVP